MQFNKIRFDGKTVELDYTRQLTEGTTETAATHGTDPSTAFKAALQAFGSYVAWVIGAPDVWLDSIEVRGVSIKRPDDEPRGIVVTAVRKCTRARNSILLINTPYLSDTPDGYAGARTGFLPAHVPEMIDLLEEQAKHYHNGERGEQIALGLDESENVKQFNDKAAAAEVASTRKPKKGKAKDFIPGAGPVLNPEATEVSTDDVLRQLLLTVDRDVPIDAIPRWTSIERDNAHRWAEAQQQHLVGQRKEEDVPAEPDCVQRDATLPLTADEWTAPRPPRAIDVDAVAIQDAARN